MIWLLLLVIAVGLSVPYWLGIVPKEMLNERRFLARMTVAGLVAGLLFNAILTLAMPDEDPSQLLVIANGAAVGALIGLIGMSVIRLRRSHAQRQQ